MRAAYAKNFPETSPLKRVHGVGEVHVIRLDTLVEGQKHGTPTAESLPILETELTTAGDAPVLLALHHPPFACGIGFMDDIGPNNRAGLRNILKGLPGRMRIVCGPIHALIMSDVAVQIAISAPSPNCPFAHDRRPEAPFGFMTHENGGLLQRWDAGFQSIRIGPMAGSGSFPF